MKVLDRIALALVIIGALNWGAVGLFRFDCVAAIFGGQAAPISRVVYALVGLPRCARRGMRIKTNPAPQGAGLDVFYPLSSSFSIGYSTAARAAMVVMA